MTKKPKKRGPKLQPYQRPKPGDPPKKGPCRPKKPKKKGRPTEFGSVLAKRICRLIRQGNRLVIAARANGIHPSTLDEWLRKGNEAIRKAKEGEPVEAWEKPFADFVEKVHEAAAKAEVLDMAVVNASPDWKAHWTKLQQRESAIYGQQSKTKTEVEVSGQVEHKQSHNLLNLDILTPELRYKIWEELKAHREKTLALPSPSVNNSPEDSASVPTTEMA